MTKNEMIVELQSIVDISLAQAERLATALVEGNDIDDDVYEIFFDHYCNNGEMPYGTAKARDGDPMEWIGDRLATELGIQ